MAHGVLHSVHHGVVHGVKHGELLFGGPAMPEFQAVGTAVSAGSASNITFAWPAHQAGDVAVVVLSAFDGPAEYAAPAGWTEVTGSPIRATGGTFNSRSAIFWRAAVDSAEPDVTILDVASDDAKYGLIFTVRGADTVDPFDVVTTAVSTADSTNANPAGATTTQANCLIVGVVAHCATAAPGPQITDWANGDLVNVTEQFDDSATDSINYGVGIVSGEKAIAGAFGATTATLSSAVTSTRFTLAFRG